MSFEDRWIEFDASRVPDPPWSDVWSLACRALVTGSGTRELESFLWRWRWSGWIVQLDEDASTCRVCGGRIGESGEALHGRRSSCSNACRQIRARCRAKNELTAWAARVHEARAVRSKLLEEVGAASKWHLRRRVLHPASVVIPPDWTSLRHAPELPSRCDRACGRDSGCDHTGGGPCLFASIGRTE